MALWDMGDMRFWNELRTAAAGVLEWLAFGSVKSPCCILGAWFDISYQLASWHHNQIHCRFAYLRFRFLKRCSSLAAVVALNTATAGSSKSIGVSS